MKYQLSIRIDLSQNLQSVHSENAEFRFLQPPSGTCFRSCFDKLDKHGGALHQVIKYSPGAI